MFSFNIEKQRKKISWTFKKKFEDLCMNDLKDEGSGDSLPGELRTSLSLPELFKIFIFIIYIFLIFTFENYTWIYSERE